MNLTYHGAPIVANVIKKAPRGMLIAQQPDILKLTRQRYVPEHAECLSRIISSTMPLWRDYNILLLGDVYYASKDIKSILRPPSGLSVEFWGHEYATPLYPMGQALAMAWHHPLPQFVKALRVVTHWFTMGWALNTLMDIHHAILDLAPDEHIIDPSRFRTLSPNTTTWDSLEEYHQWQEKHR